jgi:hypothetical protein
MTMSAALYIVLERQVPGFDHHVNGKALGRSGELLDVLADKVGTKPLMAFFSASPEEMSEFVKSHGEAVQETATAFPSERWFSAEEGLVTVRGLRDAARSEKIIDVEKILADLEEFERVLDAARVRGVRWHLAVDF